MQRGAGLAKEVEIGNRPPQTVFERWCVDHGLVSFTLFYDSLCMMNRYDGLIQAGSATRPTHTKTGVVRYEAWKVSCEAEIAQVVLRRLMAPERVDARDWLHF